MYVKIALGICIIIVPTMARPLDTLLSYDSIRNTSEANHVVVNVQSDDTSWQNVLFGVLSITVALGSFIVAMLHYRKERQSQIRPPHATQDVEMTSVMPPTVSSNLVSDGNGHSQRAATMESTRTIVAEPAFSTTQDAMTSEKALPTPIKALPRVHDLGG
ncbi:hypothetical protein BDV96DRAFT_355200 [Lophiotrema nucula]|uniref:Uncharacterized protein n=1 Tax=Lophiotrema nucula TaxID=690887 RepID=A0A6A5YFH0_9PLEO|nr:hypothetical protein BDV96DRAFT_355200 [Lophiotrema nucula]